MRHKVSGRKLKRTSSHRKALLCGLATSLFEHKKIHTTEAKAKELRPFAEQLMTKAKKALVREKLGLLPDGQKIDIHNRRVVGRFIRRKAVLQELFDAIAPVIEERPGGYTRIVKTGFRYGDGGRTAIIELVDWAAPQDGAGSLKKKRKAKATGTKAKSRAKAPKAAVTEEPKAEDAAAAVETVEPTEIAEAMPEAVETAKEELAAEEEGFKVVKSEPEAEETTPKADEEKA